MSRIVFESERPVTQVDPGRADIACFVGLVRCLPPVIATTTATQTTPGSVTIVVASAAGLAIGQTVGAPGIQPGTTVTGIYGTTIMISSGVLAILNNTAVSFTGAAISPAVQDWLTLQGWVTGPFARPLWPIFDTPIPIENYAAFATLFDGGGSPASFGTDYLAVSVRTFFAQGGKRCYVVRMGDPVTPADTPASKIAKLESLLPVTTYEIDDQRGWHGAGHLSGLPDVSFLAMPDLPALSASAPEGAKGQEPATPGGPAQFEACSNADVTPTPPLQYGASAPRLTPADYTRWAAAVQTVLLFLSHGNLREMLLVAALPMPQDTDIAAAAENPSVSLTQDIHNVINAVMPEPQGEESGLAIGISSAFLQLAYPWLKTTSSSVLLEGLESPDGALTGILARNALTRGTFASAVKVIPAEVFDVSDILPAQETTVLSTPPSWGDNSFKPLIERISLFGFTPAGLALLSDVTTFAGESYRPGRVHRLVAVILRASRRLGEQIVFKANGPRLWAQVEAFLRQLMTTLWQLNALDGATISDAFSVRCDSSTMTQNDLDNGRLVALVSFNAASTIELIRVTMALETSGTASQANIALAEAS